VRRPGRQNTLAILASQRLPLFAQTRGRSLLVLEQTSEISRNAQGEHISRSAHFEKAYAPLLGRRFIDPAGKLLADLVDRDRRELIEARTAMGRLPQPWLSACPPHEIFERKNVLALRLPRRGVYQPVDLRRRDARRETGRVDDVPNVGRLDLDIVGEPRSECSRLSALTRAR
jgi:hypothetical protein